MKNELDKKEIKNNLSRELYILQLFTIKNSLAKSIKNLRAKYVFVIYFGRKSNLRSLSKLPRKVLI